MQEEQILQGLPHQIFAGVANIAKSNIFRTNCVQGLRGQLETWMTVAVVLSNQ